MTTLISPQAGIQCIVIGDGDHIEMAQRRDSIQHRLYISKAITGASVHVQVGFPVGEYTIVQERSSSSFPDVSTIHAPA